MIYGNVEVLLNSFPKKTLISLFLTPHELVDMLYLSSIPLETLYKAVAGTIVSASS